MLWYADSIKVFLDISTYCNAGCPQCHRTDKNGLGKQDWLPLIQWDLETFKKAFPPKEVKKIQQFKFCGTWGDPVMAKDLFEMCKYIVDHNYFCFISIDTNGSIRNDDWWWNLGVYCGSQLEVVFAVDGIDQVMHEKYRRFTDLDRVLSNMETLSNTNAKVRSQTVLFKHNQDYKEEIKELVKAHGADVHTFVISDRFDHTQDGIDRFIDENGNEDTFERADQESLPDGKISGTEDSENVYEIKCRWAAPRNEVVINPDGQVLPCCFHANAHYKNRVDKTYGREIERHEIYADDYNQNLKKYNIFHTKLSDIINSEWFAKKLQASMEGDNPVPQCARNCSNRIKKRHQIRAYHAT